METWRAYLGKYNALAPREKAAALFIAAFLLVLILVTLVWSPIRSYHEDALARRDAQLGLVQHMRASEQRARDSKEGAQSRPAGQSLITEVSGAAQLAGIKPNRLQPEGSDEVSVWFDSVPFDDLIDWIVRLNDEHGISIRVISIDRQDTPGTVNARIVLRV